MLEKLNPLAGLLTAAASLRRTTELVATVVCRLSSQQSFLIEELGATQISLVSKPWDGLPDARWHTPKEHRLPLRRREIRLLLSLGDSIPTN